MAASQPLFGTSSTVNNSLSTINAKSPDVIPVSKNYSNAQNSYLVQSNNNLVANQNRYLQALNCTTLKQSRDFWAGQGHNSAYPLGVYCNALGIY